MPRKQRGVHFSVVQSVDPNTGKQVSKLIANYGARSEKEWKIISELEGDEEVDDGLTLRDPSTLTEEERKKFTVNDIFPNDGYDYSQHMMQRTSDVNYLPANYKEPPKVLPDVRLEKYSGDRKPIERDEMDKMRLQQTNISSNEKIVSRIDDVLFSDKLLVDDIDAKDLNSEEGEFQDEFDNILEELTKDGGEEEEIDDDDSDIFLSTDEDEDNVPEFIRLQKKELDQQFDKVLSDFNQLPDENETGNLEYDDVKNVMDEFQYQQNRRLYDETVDLDKDQDVIPESVLDQLRAKAPQGMIVVDSRLKRLLKDDDVDKAEMVKIMLETVRRIQENSDEEQEFEYIIDTRAKPEWDCQSIVSTYTDTENHPTQLDDVRRRKQIILSEKSGIPKNVLPTKEPAKQKFEIETKQPNFVRTKDETADEKKRRKKMAKLLAKQSRMKKKQLKQAYKKETQFQQHLDAIPSRQQKIKVNYI